MTDLVQIHAIQQVLNRFANSFDLKDWYSLGACLTDTLYTDYSQLRGTPPTTLTREQFVALRQEALQSLDTHHLAANQEINLTGDEATASVSTVIFRRRQDGEVLNTHCLYLFGLAKQNGQWKISAITQKVFWSDGNVAIHAGAAEYHSASQTRQ